MCRTACLGDQYSFESIISPGFLDATESASRMMPSRRMSAFRSRPTLSLPSPMPRSAMRR
jgi:hypothetical protein